MWWLMPVILATGEGGGDGEDHGLRLAQAKSSQDPISTNKKLSVGGTQAYYSSYVGNVNSMITVQASWHNA
jgi:hypothetical protein